MMNLLFAALMAGPAVAADVSGKLKVTGAAGEVVLFLVPQTPGAVIDSPKERAVIRQKRVRFDPTLKVVVQGQTVDFPNLDEVDHNVFSFSEAKKFDLGIYKKGESKSLLFDQLGPVSLHCSIHQYMNGTVYVAPNRLFAVTDASGRYTIKDVPPGKYTLRSWSAAMPGAHKDVVVAAGSKTTQVDLVEADFPTGKGS